MICQVVIRLTPEISDEALHANFYTTHARNWIFSLRNVYIGRKCFRQLQQAGMQPLFFGSYYQFCNVLVVYMGESGGENVIGGENKQ